MVECKFGFALEARKVRIYFVCVHLITWIAELNTALELGFRLALNLYLVNGAGCSGGAADLVSNNRSSRLIIDCEKSGLLADPEGTEGQILAVT